jgi:signal transduction histidine kinase
LLLNLRRVPTTELVEGALGVHRVAAEDRGVRLTQEVSPEAEEVEVDAERVQLVLSNLVANGVRHTPAGGEVSIRVSREGARVRFEVKDTGEGIAPEEQARIFEKFYRAPGAPAGGAGLGLSIARDIVHAHGGEMGVVSAPGQGSTFWFTLPQSASGERER